MYNVNINVHIWAHSTQGAKWNLLLLNQQVFLLRFLRCRKLNLRYCCLGIDENIYEILNHKNTKYYLKIYTIYLSTI